MTAAQQERGFITGFCGLHLAAESHSRCPERLTVNEQVHVCGCGCHTPPALSAVPDAPAAPVLISGRDGEHQGDYDLSDALLHLVTSVQVLDRALGDFDGSDLECLDLLGHIRQQRQELARIESVLENQAVRLMTQDQVEWPGGSAERRWGKDRKEWKHDDLVRAVTAAIIPPLAVNPATGEVDSDLAALLHQAVEQYAATNRPSWRVTAVKPLGIDPDEYCSAVPGRATVQVNLAGEQ